MWTSRSRPCRSRLSPAPNPPMRRLGRRPKRQPPRAKRNRCSADLPPRAARPAGASPHRSDARGCSSSRRRWSSPASGCGIGAGVISNNTRTSSCAAAPAAHCAGNGARCGKPRNRVTPRALPAARPAPCAWPAPRIIRPNRGHWSAATCCRCLNPAQRAGATGEVVRRVFTVTDANCFDTNPADAGELLLLQPELERVLEQLEAKL